MEREVATLSVPGGPEGGRQCVKVEEGGPPRAPRVGRYCKLLYSGPRAMSSVIGSQVESSITSVAFSKNSWLVCFDEETRKSEVNYC